MKKKLQVELWQQELRLQWMWKQHSVAVGADKRSLRRDIARKEMTIYRIQEALGMSL